MPIPRNNALTVSFAKQDNQALIELLQNGSIPSDWQDKASYEISWALSRLKATITQTTTKLTALPLAILLGNQALFDLAIEKDADIRQPDEFGYTPLMIAAAANQPTMVKQLLEAGASLLKRASDDHTIHSDNALNLAIARNAQPCIDILLDHAEKKKLTSDLLSSKTVFRIEKADLQPTQTLDGSLLHTAAWVNNVSAVNALLRLADLHNVGLVNRQDNRGDTALHVGVRIGSEQVIEAVQAHHAKHLKNQAGQTPEGLARSLYTGSSNAVLISDITKALTNSVRTELSITGHALFTTAFEQSTDTASSMLPSSSTPTLAAKP